MWRPTVTQWEQHWLKRLWADIYVLYDSLCDAEHPFLPDCEANPATVYRKQWRAYVARHNLCLSKQRFKRACRERWKPWRRIEKCKQARCRIEKCQ